MDAALNLCLTQEQKGRRPSLDNAVKRAILRVMLTEAIALAEETGSDPLNRQSKAELQAQSNLEWMINDNSAETPNREP